MRKGQIKEPSEEVLQKSLKEAADYKYALEESCIVAITDQKGIKDFIVPEKGLEYIQSEFSANPQEEKTVLFLDLNIPTMSGWEFLEKFETMESPIQKQFDIYILSSSVDPRDLEKAKENPLIIDFIEKPLEKKMLLKMFG